MTTDDSIERAREIASKIDNFVLSLQERRYGQAWDASMDPENDKVSTFVEAYVSSGRYPLVRLEQCALRAVDIRLQPEYVYFDLGIDNLYWHSGSNGEPALGNPIATLAHMAVIQSTIVRVRILWEKIFRLVYYLENGTDLEASGKKSVKGKFFEWCGQSPSFRFLEVYAKTVADIDEQWRTGEVHKHSRVRSLVIGGGEEIDVNAVLEPLNRAYSVFGNVISVVRSGFPDSFCDLHLIDPTNPSSEINPRYYTSAGT